MRLSCVLFLLCFAAHGLPAEDRPPPSEFYIVSKVTSDMWPFWYRYFLHVTAEGRGSVVRNIRIAPAATLCSDAITVKAAMVTLAEVSPAKLLKGRNPCAIDTAAIHRKLAERKRAANIDDSVEFGIVARCGAEETVLRLPYPEQVQFDRLRKKSPELARWWDIAGDVGKRAFGADSVFYGVSAERERQLLRDGEAALATLRTERFDSVLGPGWFREIERRYAGPGVLPEPTAKLLQAEQYHFNRYVSPPFPLLAQHARIQGTVELNVFVNRETGEIREVRVIVGHPLFGSTVMETTKKWRFEPGSILSDAPIEMVFAFGCPGPG